MNKYFNVNYFDMNTVKFLNDEAINNNVNICLKNTASLTSNMVKYLNPNISIRIIGGLDKPKYNNYRYAYRSTYTPVELTNILRKFEKLEKGIKPKWSKKEVALYIYEQLSMYIKFPDNHNSVDPRYKSGLNAMNTGHAICCGYSLIFKEMMDRQDIRCDYVKGSTPMSRDLMHAWNVLHIDGEIIPVDVTWAADKYQQNHKITHNFFGANKEFIEKHRPDSDEVVQEYKENINIPKEEISFDDTNHKVELIDRYDGSKFYLSKIGEEVVKGKTMYKYMQAELENGCLGRTNILYSEQDYDKSNDQWKSRFNNILLEKNRIKKYGGLSGAYMGYIDDNGRKTINPNFRDIQGKITNISRFDNSNISLEEVDNQNLDDINVYNTYEFVIEEGIVNAKKNTIYSETKLNRCNNEQLSNFSNYIINRKRLDRKIESNCGYVGTYTMQNAVTEYEVSKDKIVEMAKCM